MEYAAFERRLLRFIFRTNAPLRPVTVAYYLDVPVAETRLHMDHAVDLGVLELDSDEHGRVVYACPDRPPLASLAAPKRRRRRRFASEPNRSLPARPRALERATSPSALQARELEAFLLPGERPSSATAAALSLVMPGAGHIYCGMIPQGVAWMMATGMGYLLFIVPGLILHLCCVINAAALPSRMRQVAAARGG